MVEHFLKIGISCIDKKTANNKFSNYFVDIVLQYYIKKEGRKLITMTGYIKKSFSGCDNYKKDCDKDIKEKKTEPKRIIFECGESVEMANFDVSSSEEETFTLARVFVDTRQLCRPQVKIEFSTLVTFESAETDTSVDIRMTFALKRQCGDGPVMTIREWEYINDFSFNTPIEFDIESVNEPFTISFCEPLQCPDCCKYFVDVTATPSTDFDNIESAVVNPGNDASMSAFAKGICCD